MMAAMMTKEDRLFIKKEIKGLDQKIETEIGKLARMTQAEFLVVNAKLDDLSKVVATHRYDIDRLKMKAGLD